MHTVTKSLSKTLSQGFCPRSHWFRLLQTAEAHPRCLWISAGLHCSGFWPVISQWASALCPIFTSPVYLTGCLLCWLCPQYYVLLEKYTSYRLLLSQKHTHTHTHTHTHKGSALSRWEEGKVPSRKSPLQKKSPPFSRWFLMTQTLP